MKKQVFLLCFTFSITSLIAQNLHKLDSLNNLINKNVHDTIKIKAMNSVAEEFWYCNPDTVLILAQHIIDKATLIDYPKGIYYGNNNIAASYLIKRDYNQALIYYQENEKICLKNKDKLSLAVTYNNLGLTYSSKKDFSKAKDYYLKAIDIYLILKDDSGLARAYNNLGLIFYHQSLYSEALDLFYNSLKIKERLKDDIGIVNSQNNIAIIYYEAKDFDKAIEYYTLSLERRIKLNDRYGIADSYSNLATTYENMNKYNLALSFYEQALDIFYDLNDQSSISTCLNNIGFLYQSKKNYKTAMEYYMKAVKIREETNDSTGLSTTFNNIGQVYYKTNNLKRAKEFLLKGIKLAEETEFLAEAKDAYIVLSEIFEKTGEFKNSLIYIKKYIELKDSTLNDESIKKITQAELKYSYEKKMFQDSLKRENLENIRKLKRQKEDIKKEEVLKRQQLYIYSGIGGMILLMFIAVTLLRSNRMKQRSNLTIREQKREVENQKIIVENKNKEITDSIIYAQRIQKAIIPSDEKLIEIFKEIFVLYKPKDIVAGDFYWIEKKNDRTFIASVDCTGHGVPGAMVSVVGFNGLNYAVNELNLTSPSEILDALNLFVEKSFGKGKEEISDGMDITLCSFDFKNNILEFAGANNPVWFVQNNELKNIPGDKQPVGKFRDRIPFNCHSVKIYQGDIFYLFTDGFADQFGGPKGKKFKYSRLREILVNIQSLSLPEQEKILEKEFHKWKGNLEQVDDILFIGIKI